MSAHPVAHRSSNPVHPCVCEDCLAQRAKDREARGFWTVPETEPSDEQVARWQAEVERDMKAADRSPVGVTQSHQYGLPVVVCRDGTVWILESRAVGPEAGDGRLYSWEMLPPIPGSQGDLGGVYWKEAQQNGRTDATPDLLKALRDLVRYREDRQWATDQEEHASRATDGNVSALEAMHYRAQDAIAKAEGRPS